MRICKRDRDGGNRTCGRVRIDAMDVVSDGTTSASACAAGRLRPRDTNNGNLNSTRGWSR